MELTYEQILKIKTSLAMKGQGYIEPERGDYQPAEPTFEEVLSQVDLKKLRDFTQN